MMFEKLAKKKYDFKYSLCFYLLFLILINILTTIAYWLVLKVAVRYEDLNTSPMVALRYVLIAFAISFIVGVVFGWIKKNVKCNIVVKKEKKNGKAKKSS